MKKIIIIIVVGLLVFGVYAKKDGLNIFAETIKEFELVESYPRDELSRFGLFKDNICHWKDGKIEILKINGEDKPVSLGVNIQDPLIEYGKNYIYFANPLEGQIYFINEKAELVERIETGREIFSIKEVGNHLVYHVKEDLGECIGIVNKKGEKVMSYEFPNEIILTYNLDRTGKVLLVSKLEIEEGNIKSCVEKYDSGEKKENIYFQYELIIDIHIINSNDFILLTDSNVYRLSDQEIVWNKEFNLIKDIDFEGKNLYVLYSNYLEILDFDGKVKEKLNFDEDYNSIKVKNAGLIGVDIILSGANRVSVIQPNKDVVTKKQIVNQVDFYEDYYFILDDEKYGRYDVVKNLLEKELEK